MQPNYVYLKLYRGEHLWVRELVSQEEKTFEISLTAKEVCHLEPDLFNQIEV